MYMYMYAVSTAAGGAFPSNTIKILYILLFIHMYTWSLHYRVVGDLYLFFELYMCIVCLLLLLLLLQLFLCDLSFAYMYCIMHTHVHVLVY